MLEPEERVAYGCRVCRDVGLVADGLSEEKCPACSAWDEERRDQAYSADLARRGEKPSLRESDLTREELEILAGWRVTFPRASGLTLLLWIEGRRYSPAADPEFLALVGRKLREWRFISAGSNEGAVPGRIAYALRTGETEHLTVAECDRWQKLAGEMGAA